MTVRNHPPEVDLIHHLTLFGNVLRRRGVAPEAIIAALIAENGNSRPPLPESGVRLAARAVSRAAPVDEFVTASEAAAEKIVGELEKNRDSVRTQFPELILEMIAKIPDRMRREFFVSRVAQVYRGIISRNRLLESVAVHRLSLEADEAATSREELQEELRKIPISAGQLVLDLEHYFAGYLSLPPGLKQSRYVKRILGIVRCVWGD